MRILTNKRWSGKMFVVVISNLLLLSIVLLIQRHDHLELFAPLMLKFSFREKTIPKIVHFVLGQTDREGLVQKYAPPSPFSFFNYLTLLAARIQIQPTVLFVHYYEEPNTFWWNQSKQDPEIKMTLVKTRLLEKIFSKHVDHHAHRSDILRLEIMMKYGGIYLDTDVLALRSFDSLLNMHDVAMAYQENDKKQAGIAVILARKNALFLKRWYDAYQSFDSNCWACHSVLLPGQLAALYPNEIKMLPTETFFRPSWTESRRFFQENNYNFTSNYATHLWNKINQRELNLLTPRSALSMNNTFARMIRRAIGEERLRKLAKLSFKGH